MEIIKYAHACLVVEKNGQALVIDPGLWSHDFKVPPNVVGVVMTHGHADHCDEAKLADIRRQNPQARLYAPADVAGSLASFAIDVAKAGETVHVGDFALTFYGGEHAGIDEALPGLENVGVMVDGSLYYPGDSFSRPDQPVTTLAVPAAAPWMKFSEAADFIRAVRPKEAFPTHDAILSSEGKQLADRMLGAVCDEVGATYRRR